MSNLRLLDLFCGAGGASEGYRQAGIEIAVAVDHSPEALVSHELNHPDTEHLEMDLTDPEKIIELFTKGEFDLIHGSPPCTQFSTSKMDADPAAGMELVRSYEAVVSGLEPRFWVMENVRGVLPHLISDLYPVKRVLCAADFGVPQKRYRAFCGQYRIPIPTHTEKGPQATLTGRIMQPWISIKDAIGLESPLILETRMDLRDGEYKQQREIDELAPTMSTRSAGQWQLVSKQNISGQRGRPLVREADQPAFTLTSTLGGVHLREGHEGGERRLITPAECALLQGFPSTYQFVGNKTSKGLQIGNAVPPPVTQAIGLALVEE